MSRRTLGTPQDLAQMQQQQAIIDAMRQRTIQRQEPVSQAREQAMREHAIHRAREQAMREQVTYVQMQHSQPSQHQFMMNPLRGQFQLGENMPHIMPQTMMPPLMQQNMPFAHQMHVRQLQPEAMTLAVATAQPSAASSSATTASFDILNGEEAHHRASHHAPVHEPRSARRARQRASTSQVQGPEPDRPMQVSLRPRRQNPAVAAVVAADQISAAESTSTRSTRPASRVAGRGGGLSGYYEGGPSWGMEGEQHSSAGRASAAGQVATTSMRDVLAASAEVRQKKLALNQGLK